MNARGGKPWSQWLVSVALVAPWAVGCGGGRDEDDYTPSEAMSRAAIELALRAWQDARPERDLSLEANGALACVEFIDKHRQPAQRLESYQILGETASRNGRAFVVRLSLREPDEELKVRYLVVGIDPLWVFRQEDYDMLSHWDHAMPSEDDPSAPAEINVNTATTKRDP